MEGCPRSLMLNVDLKESFPTEFTPSLKTYIREHYNEDADSYKNECSQLEQLRTASLRPSHDHSGCSTLRRYYAQLQFLQSRFPMGDGEAVNVQFTWTDLYSEEPISLFDIRFEQASILHNLAALHSQLGCHEDRTTEEGMKVACTHFQAAAGIFQYLKAGSFCRVEHFIDHFASDAFFDMAGGLLQVYTNVMLGQAQECLLEKSILDSRKDSLIARISMQVHDYYNQALQFLDSQGPSYMGSRKAKIWTKNLKIKCCQYLAVAYIHMSNNADENQKFGEKVAYLKAASQKITEAQKASKGQPERTLELLQFLVDVVSNKLQGAVKDNDFIYHEVVPELDSLTEIRAAPLVKPIPFQPCDSTVSGPDIFQRLVPMEAHTDSSLYSEEKAKLLRRYVGSIEQKNHLLSKALSDLHIDDLLEPEGYDTLPAVIIQKSKSLKKDGNLKDVENNVEELTKVGSKVEELLESLAKILEEDKTREKELQELYGPMTPPPEREDFEKDLEQCRESHKKATQTNTELLKVFKEHKHNLGLLVGPSEGLLAALPSLNIIDTPIDDGAVQRLRDLISKVELMKSQRKQFEADLRKQLADDDITQLLVTREEGSKTIFFEEQLKKHDATCDLIQKNLDAQSKILKALTEANAKYAPTRQAVKATAQRRDDAVQAFVVSHNTFFELKEKLSRGLRFYQGLEKSVLKLEEKLKEFAENRKKEMDKIEEKEKKAKEKAKAPPARPAAVKPDHLVNLPASSAPGPMANQYPGGAGMPHPGMRPGAPHPTPYGVPFQPRIPGGTFPPGSLPGATPPRPTDPRIYPPVSQGVPARPPFSLADQRMRAPHPGVPPQTIPDSRSQHIFPEQRVPQLPASPVAGPPMRPSIPPQPAVPFSQMGPRGPAPAEHLIHSTPRMSYPVPVGTSLPPGGPQGFQAVAPGGPYQTPQPPRQQPRPQLTPEQVPNPGGAAALPSYDQAKFMPGSQPINRTQQAPIPPPQNWPQGQHPAPSQQQPGGQQLYPSQLNRPPNLTPQQQFLPPKGPQSTLQPQYPSQAGSPQMYQQQIPSSQMSQPLQPAPNQHQPKNWQTQPFQFPKLAQQSMQPQQQFQQPQQPYQIPQQQPHSQQPFQQPPPGQPRFPPPLEPQKVPPSQSQIRQQFQPPQPSQPQQKPQQPLHFQQQQQPQHLPQPPQQFQQPMQQFKQPVHIQPQFPQPQQQVQHLREPLQPTQYQQTQQQQQQQQQQKFQPPLQPQQNYQQQLQPLQPQKPPQQSQYQPPLQPQPHSMQQPLQGQQIPTDRLPQQIPHPGQTPPQNMQSSLSPVKPKQISQVSELPPKGQSQIGQMPGPSTWQQQSSNLPPQSQQPGYPIQQPYTGYSQSQQPSQSSNTSAQLGYPVLPEKKRSHTDQLSSKSSQEGFPPQLPGFQRPGGLQPSPHQQNTSPGSSQSWGYPQASQSLPSTGSSLSDQRFSCQNSKEQQHSGGKHMQAPQKPMPYEQKPVDQGWGPSLGVKQPSQGQIRQDQAAYQPVITRPNSADYGNQSQYQGQTRGRLASYPPYSEGVSEPPSASPAGSQPYSFSQGSAPTAPPLVQGVRPSPTSLPPSSAYATSYSVSVAQAQLSQQQQMQQLQTQMLLQQQQLILQQQELLRHQQQQQQHESDQGHLTQLFQQVLQQQTKLAEMEQKIAEHERHEEQLKKGLSKESLPAGKDTQAADKDPHVKPPHSSGSFSASWSSGFSDHVHNKLDMEQFFSDLAKKQISEISEKGKHTDECCDSSKPPAHADDEVNAATKNAGASEHSEKELVGDESTQVKGASGNEINNSVNAAETEQMINTEMESGTIGGEINKESVSSGGIEQKGEEKPEVDISSSAEGKPEDESQKAEETSDEDKEKQRRQGIEEQIQKIKELQKNTQPVPPPLPQKQKYLYEPGKMPELDQLPLKPPEAAATVEPSKPPLHRQCGHYYNTQYSSIGQAENNDCLSEEEYIQRLSRTVETFEALVMGLAQKRENSPYNGFINEWKVLEKFQESDSAFFSTQAASLNPSKNRYRDILPWDHTRVKLTSKEGGDYVNANIIKKVTPLSPDYILTQGPIAATLGDFWLLVWEQKVPVVVMLTKEVEGNRLKCHQYWPIDEGHTVVYGAIRVHMRRVSHCQAWIERIMHVQHAESDEVLVVSHLQFVGWPDHGVPHSPSDLLTFLSEVHNHHQERDPQAQRPLLVHCSAGVGRAGTFCVVYTAIRELNGTGNIVNIPKLVRMFRKHRKFTVQKKEQYEFCYRAVLFYANQFVQLEKTAIAFKKAKAESREQLGDVSDTSSVTSPGGSGQQKLDDVNYLGEISSDESSSESGTEFDREGENDMSKGKISQGPVKSELENADESNNTDKQSSELKDSSEMSSNSLSAVKDTLHTSETSTVDADLSAVITKAEGKIQVQDSPCQDSKQTDSTASDALDVSMVNTDLSAAVEQAEEDIDMVGSSAHDAKSTDTLETAASMSSEEFSVMSARGVEKVKTDDCIEKQKDLSSDQKSCVEDEVEETKTVLASVKEVEEIKMDPASSKKTGDVETDDVKVEKSKEKTEEELANIDVPISVAQNDKQNVEKNVESDLLDEKSSSEECLGKVDSQRGKENENGRLEEEIEKRQGSELQGEETSEQHENGNKKETYEEQHEIPDIELHNEQTGVKEPEHPAQTSEDDKQTEDLKDKDSGSPTTKIRKLSKNN